MITTVEVRRHNHIMNRSLSRLALTCVFFVGALTWFGTTFTITAKTNFSSQSAALAGNSTVRYTDKNPLA